MREQRETSAVRRPRAVCARLLLLGRATAALLTIPATSAAAQDPPRPVASQAATEAATGRVPLEAPAVDGRADGPRRHRPLLALLEVAGINVAYNLANRVLPYDEHDEFRVTPDSWASNLGHGFDWDND